MSQGQEQPAQPNNTDDENSRGLNVFSFFIPLIGAILYFAKKDEYPNKAKGIGRAALMGFVYGLIYIIFKALMSSHK